MTPDSPDPGPEIGAQTPGVNPRTARHGNQLGFNASRVIGLFADARKLDHDVDAQGWKHLFTRFGLEGLIDLAKNRQAGWPDRTTDEVVAEAIVSESLDAGYDPVSGLIGTFEKETRRFAPQNRMGTASMHEPNPKDQHE